MKHARGDSTSPEEVELPLVGREQILRRVSIALDNHESLLLLGPAGAGKTRILRSVLTRLRGRAAYLEAAPILHDTLVRLGAALCEAAHRSFCEMVGDEADPGRWLARQTSVHLRGLLRDALESEPMPIFLDDVRGADHRAMRFFHYLYFTEGMTIVAAARDFPSLGALRRLFWDPRHIVRLPPLRHSEAEHLFELAVSRFKLGEIDLDEFRPQVLKSAAGNPGQIIDMCRRAGLPQYRAGAHVKFSLVRIDTVTRFLR